MRGLVEDIEDTVGMLEDFASGMNHRVWEAVVNTVTDVAEHAVSRGPDIAALSDNSWLFCLLAVAE